MDDHDALLSPEVTREIKTQYNKAKDILEKINSLSVRFDAAFKAFETRNFDVEKVSNNVREKLLSVEKAKEESSTIIVDIKSNLDRIQSSISQIEDASIKFEGIKGRIEGKEGEMDALLSAAKGLRSDVETAKVVAHQRLVDIDNQFAQVQEKIVQIQKAYEEFVAVRARIKDPETGLEAILSQSLDLQKQSNKTFADIKSFHEQSEETLLKIKANKTETDKIKSEAKLSLEEINSKKSEVVKVTALITDTGFANSFQKREKMLRYGAGLWLVVLLSSIGGLAFMLYKLFSGIQGVPEFNTLLYRLTLTSPLLFLIGVSIKQYSHERSLNEKYAFKATIAAVIRHHTDFLTQTAQKAGMETSNFMRNVLEQIYIEPYEKGMNTRDLKDEIESILSQKDNKKTSKFVEAFKVAKELKEIVPDDATLKSLMELLVKLK